MISIKLRSVLERKGISQAELARMTGIRAATICDLYNNNADFIRLDYLDKICDVLGCGIDDVLVKIVTSESING